MIDQTDAKARIERLCTIHREVQIHGSTDPECLFCSLRDEALRLAERECYHGWRGRPPKDGRHIKTRCLSCRTESLFVGDGGHLTCASVPSHHSDGCKNPSVQEQMDQLEQENARLKAEADKTASLQEASRFYRVCDVCHTSSFETTPDGERCGYCCLKAEVERLRKWRGMPIGRRIIRMIDDAIGPNNRD